MTSYVDQVWWRLLKNCDLYRVPNKQTDRQTNIPLNEHTCKNFYEILASNDYTPTCDHPVHVSLELKYPTGFKISNWMHLSVGQVDCKNHLSECTIHMSEIYKTNATYVKIINMQSSVRQVLQVFHLSDSDEWNLKPCPILKFLWNPIPYICEMSNHLVTPKFCTCHDSRAVVACAKYGCDSAV